MNRNSEVPDFHVVCQAQQFCDTAELLLRNSPAVSAPSALKCNAAFAIELFLKSLDSHWVHHPLYDEMDDEASTMTAEPDVDEMENEASIITTKPNKVKEHRLDFLFDALPIQMQGHLTAEFQANPLCDEHASLQSLLRLYGNAFVTERYPFENKDDPDRRPIGEIVKLARFFREVVDRIPRERY